MISSLLTLTISEEERKKVTTFVGGKIEEEIQLILNWWSQMVLYRKDGEQISYSQEGWVDWTHWTLEEEQYKDIKCIVNWSKRKLIDILKDYKIID